MRKRTFDLSRLQALNDQVADIERENQQLTQNARHIAELCQEQSDSFSDPEREQAARILKEEQEASQALVVSMARLRERLDFEAERQQ